MVTVAVFEPKALVDTILVPGAHMSMQSLKISVYCRSGMWNKRGGQGNESVWRRKKEDEGGMGRTVDEVPEIRLRAAVVVAVEVAYGDDPWTRCRGNAACIGISISSSNDNCNSRLRRLSSARTLIQCLASFSKGQVRER